MRIIKRKIKNRRGEAEESSLNVRLLVVVLVVSAAACGLIYFLVGPLVFGGIRLPLTHNFTIGGEVRYQRAEGELDASLFNGDRIDLGDGRDLEVIHTPGHSPGSMVLLLDGYAFTGDTLFVEAVGRTDLPGGSGEVMFDSIQRKLCTLPDETVVLPGHNYGSMPTSTIGHEKQYNPFLR